MGGVWSGLCFCAANETVSIVGRCAEVTMEFCI